MSVVKINAIEVAPGSGPELEERFARRAAEVETWPGFESFELLRRVATGSALPRFEVVQQVGKRRG